METNRVYHSDALEFIPKLDDNSIDLAIIDPPYNLNKGDWDKFENDEMYFDFTFKWLDMVIPKLKSSASLYLFNTAYNSAIILSYLRNKDLVFRNWITWYKKDGFSATKKKYVNAQETILFFTKSDSYTFNYNDIRMPYLSTDRMAHAAKKGILKNGKRWFPNENGCPFSRDFEFELETIKQNEPNLYIAVNNIFGKSYEYTRKYKIFYKNKEEKLQKFK